MSPTNRRPGLACIITFLLLYGAAMIGCAPADPPPPYEKMTLSGSPYERGLAHGKRFSSKIRSLYTQLLTSALLPSLNRERPDIAEVLFLYQDERYDDGRFSYEVLLDSAYALEESIPEHYLEEIRGIAHGSGLPYGDALLLNTFVDSVLGVRTMQRYLSQWHAPFIRSIEIVPGDDSSENGAEESDAWVQDPFEPLFHAHFVGVPTSSSIRIVIEDAPGVRAENSDEDEQDPADEENHIGVDPESIRIRLDDELFTKGDDGIHIELLDERGIRLAVTLSPPGGLPPSAVIAIGVEAGNLIEIHDPPPTRSRIMRQQWIALATEGLDVTADEIPNSGGHDDRFPPPPIAFAAHGNATSDGAMRLAHHFALLDAGTLHRHVVLFTHKPDDGIPHVTVGWTGLVGGFSGMNAEGLVWSVNHSDTLDNPVVQNVRRKLELLSGGLPITMLGREVLSRTQDVDAAADLLVEIAPTVGWNHLLAGPGGLRVVESDGDISGEGDGHEHVYGPGAVDDHGRRLAAFTDDDIRIASHYISNADDYESGLLGFDLPPQRYWSPFWSRSLRAFYLLGVHVSDKIGHLDSDAMIGILRTEGLYDPRDSMNAVVYEPEDLRLWLAAGTVPATDAPFEAYDVAEALRGTQ